MEGTPHLTGRLNIRKPPHPPPFRTVGIALACALTFLPAGAQAQTILERVLALGRSVDYGLIFANLAENALPAFGPPRGQPGVDGSITLVAQGGAGWDTPARALAASLPALQMQDMTAMAISAVNGGQAVTDYAVTVDLTALPGGSGGGPVAPDLSGALAALGPSGLGLGAAAGDAAAGLTARTMAGGAPDLPAALVLNAAASMQDVSARVSTALSGLDATIDDTTATALGSVNTGDVLAGIDRVVIGVTGN